MYASSSEGTPLGGPPWPVPQRQNCCFCSYVQGAFDRVRAERLAEKLRKSGVPMQLVKVLISWLESRRAKFVVEGSFSEDAGLQDMVYQGTVLGPPLCGIFSSRTLSRQCRTAS